MGRVERERWGPREIDLDLLLFGPHVLRVERDGPARSAAPSRGGWQWLEVPHPLAQDRSFVLAPLADLAPSLVPPGWDVNVGDALERAAVIEGADAVEAIGTWDVHSGHWKAP